MTDGKRVLVAEDHQRTRNAWAELISSWGFEVEAAEDGQRALELVGSFEPHILLLDLKLPLKDGLEVLGEIRRRGLPITTIVISGEGDIPDAVQAIKLGAYDYLRKPVDPPRLRQTLNNLSEHLAVSEENQRLRLRLMGAGELGPIVGQSQAMRRVMALIEQAAPSSASVIIQGESGTGKEIVARTIHEYSPRRGGPYVAINCAALPEGLLESELFGHERGAFTGADARRAGCFELANGGTLLLDEIGEMKPELQAKLLRVIEERKLRRVGGSADIALNVRVLAATNRDLGEALRAGRLRDDLYYRLNVFTIALPRLAERLEDLPALTDHFVREFARANGRQITGVDNECLEALKARAWPGNVRELRNAIERAVIVSAGPLIGAADLPAERVLAGAAAAAHSAPPPPAPAPASAGLGAAPSAAEPASPGCELPVGQPLREVERQLILKTLEMVGNNRVRAAEILGISPKTLYNKLGRYQAKSAAGESEADDGEGKDLATDGGAAAQGANGKSGPAGKA
ncbi:MAG TPA: sigma-54 dependent transcriptional regulator [Candidatus Binataceae bacterium]|nr:sigma-54 dependent transcriptional regulator [Candidatus Binataceae bacterium]